MVSFKQFLAEASTPKNVVKKWTSRKLDIDRAIKLLNTHCKDGLKAISNDGVIQRGFNEKLPHNLQVMDSTNSERRSRDTNNLYQMMMDSSEALKGYPSRTNSFICLSARSEYYGSRYVMIPYDGTKIAILDKDDIFDVGVKNVDGIMRGNVPSFSGVSMSGISSSVMTLLKFFKIGPEVKVGDGYKFGNQSAAIDKRLANISPKTLTIAYEFLINKKGVSGDASILYDDMTMMYPYDHDKNVHALGKLISYYNTHEFNDSKRFYDLMSANPDKKFTAWCSAIFTPENMNMSLKQYGEALPYRKECWFSGKAIVMSLTLWAGILIELQKQGFPVHESVARDASPEIKYILDMEEKKQDIAYESVNVDNFKKGFRMEKSIPNSNYKLIASCGWINKGDVSDELKVTAMDGRTEAGYATFKINKDSLEAHDLQIKPMFRRKGIASEIYKFVEELGNTIKPSNLQTNDGKKFWANRK